MEIRKPKIKSIPYEEFKDNETLEKLAQELNEGGTNVIVGSSTKPSTGPQQLAVVADLRHKLLRH